MLVISVKIHYFNNVSVQVQYIWLACNPLLANLGKPCTDERLKFNILKTILEKKLVEDIAEENIAPYVTFYVNDLTYPNLKYCKFNGEIISKYNIDYYIFYSEIESPKIEKKSQSEVMSNFFQQRN